MKHVNVDKFHTIFDRALTKLDQTVRSISLILDDNIVNIIILRDNCLRCSIDTRQIGKFEPINVHSRSGFLSMYSSSTFKVTSRFSVLSIKTGLFIKRCNGQTSQIKTAKNKL